MWWLLSFFVVPIYFWIIKPLSFWKDLGVPYKQPWPIFGNAASSLFSKKTFFDLVRDAYNLFPNKRYYGFYQFMTPALILRDIDLIKKVVVKDFDHFVDHAPFVSEQIEPLVAKSLFALKGQQWRDMRATLSPSFTSSKIKSMFFLVSDCAEQLTSFFEKRGTQKITVDMKDVVARFTNDVIGSVAFGLKVDSFVERDNQFFLNGKNATSFSPLRFILFSAMPRLLKFFNLQFFPKTMPIFFRRVIKENIKQRESEGLVRPDMIQLLLEARKSGHKEHNNYDDTDAGFAAAKTYNTSKAEKYNKLELSDEDITAQATVFYFAGFETSAMVISFLAYELALNLEIQERLRREIDEVSENCDGKITYDAILKMKYLDMVVSEGLRKWPAGFQLDRVCVKDYTIAPEMLGETPVTLKKGQLLLIPVVGIHYDPIFFPNPDKFDPERFNDINKQNIQPASYMPFGAGPRSCIALRFALLEIKLFFFHLLSKFVLSPVKETPIPVVLVSQGFNVMPDGGFWLGIQQRDY